MILGIVCIVLESILMASILYRIGKSKQISLKDTSAYPFLVIISAVLIFYSQLKYGTYDAWYKIIPASLSGALSLLTMSLDKNLVALLSANNFVLLVGYILAYIIAAMALFSISISLFKVTLKNKLRFKFKNEEIDYLFSLSEDAKVYIKNLTPEQRKKTVVVLHKKMDAAYKAEKLFLDDQKVKLVVEPFQTEQAFLKTIRKLMRFKRAKKFYFVSFSEQEKEIFTFITGAKRYLQESKQYDGKVQFVVGCSPAQRVCVQQMIKGKPDEMVLNLKNKSVPLLDESRGCVRSYDKYALLAFDFIRTHDFAKSFPRALLQRDATVTDCRINLFVLGFGKVNQALVKDVLINTQFITKKPSDTRPGKYELKPIRLNTYIFDENKASADLALSSGIMKYDKTAFDPKDYFELPEDYRSHVTFFNEYNVEGVMSFDRIREIVSAQRAALPQKPVVNYYIVSLRSDFENVAIAQKLLETLPPNESYNVVYVRTENEKLSNEIKNENLIPFGHNSTVLSYDNLIADKTFTDAKVQHCVYGGLPATPDNVSIEWNTLSKIKQESNLYAIASIPFKLSLLQEDTTTPIETVRGRYDPEGRRWLAADERLDLEQIYPYLFPSVHAYPREVIACSEHERWLAHQLSMGVLPMKTELLGKLYTNKTDNELFHSCITTNRGLSDYYKTLKALKANAATEEQATSLGDADVFKYDSDLIDNYIKN